MTVIQEVKDLALSKLVVNVPSPRRQRQVKLQTIRRCYHWTYGLSCLDEDVTTPNSLSKEHH